MRFVHDADLRTLHAQGCACGLHRRRLFAAAVLAAGAAPVWAQKNSKAPIDPTVACKDYDKISSLTKVISAEQVEEGAQAQYGQMLREATNKNALGPSTNPQVIRLRAIADRMVPFTRDCNPRALQWKWEVNLLGSNQLNAFCMPGGKIAFFHGILSKLQLNDDEVAAIMGHEIAHALREHARERMGKTMLTRLGAGVIGALLGAGSLGDAAVSVGGQLLTLTFSRSDETEADLVGMELAARAGYDPAAGVTLWQKMMAASKGAPPKWLSTHPSGKDRIKEIQAKLPRVQPLYDAAAKPKERFAPPPVAAASAPSR